MIISIEHYINVQRTSERNLHKMITHEYSYSLMIFAFRQSASQLENNWEVFFLSFTKQQADNQAVITT